MTRAETTNQRPGKSVLISGAGIVGSTLARWLLARGFTPALVEQAPQFRTGGYIIDFWGVGFDVAERMGLIPALRAAGYVNDRIVFVRADGSVRSCFGGAALRRALGDRFLSIRRGDLALEIWRGLAERAEVIFGDSIASLDETPDGVDVTFESGRRRSFELVVGADGLRSVVRRHAFGDTPDAEQYLGYCAAAFATGGYARRDEHTYLSYAAPGRQISRFALRNDGTGFLLVFAWPADPKALPRDMASQKKLLIAQFRDEPWMERSEILSRLEASDDLYFDAVSQIHIPRWSKGRVALVGDAAYCPSLLAGEGSVFAVAGAYILAGELDRAAGDFARAFCSYEQSFKPFIEHKQKAARAFISSFTPRTAAGLFVRDIVLKLGAVPAIADLLMRHFVADRFQLPDYPAPAQRIF